jgi:multisubunit Na+/H+ antiporter MnhB subunit
VLVAALSTGHKVGLLVVAGVFIAFALASSLLASRKRPDFPGRAGLSVYVIACFVLFAAMVIAVVVFGREKKEGKAAPAVHRAAAAQLHRAA